MQFFNFGISHCFSMFVSPRRKYLLLSYKHYIIMKIAKNAILGSALVGGLFMASCQPQEEVSVNNIPGHVLEALAANGFSTNDVVNYEAGYLVEGDIYMTEDQIMNFGGGHTINEQYRTTNLVNAGGGRNITMYANQGGRNGYSAGMIAGLDLAIQRYNDENLSITFSRLSSGGSEDITMTRLKKGDERRGVLGSAGFPTASGDPHNEIKMSGILESSYGLSTEGIATIIAHEMGHCIGFRHTDYFDRSISCGGGTSNEGASTVGAIHIPGTPTGASASAKSFMLACTDGSDRPFNNDDKTALNYMY